MLHFTMSFHEYKEQRPSSIDWLGYLSVRLYKTKQIDCMISQT